MKPCFHYGRQINAKLNHSRIPNISQVKCCQLPLKANQFKTNMKMMLTRSNPPQLGKLIRWSWVTSFPFSKERYGKIKWFGMDRTLKVNPTLFVNLHNLTKIDLLGQWNKYSRGKSSNDVTKVPRLVEISSFLMQYQYWKNYLRPALQFFSHFLNSRKRGDNE